MDLKGEVTCLDYGGQKAVLAIMFEYTQPPVSSDVTESEISTSDSDKVGLSSNDEEI